MDQGVIIMNRQDQKIYQLASEVLSDRLTLVEFSLLIGKSYRQSQRILKKIEDKGLFGVKHGNLNKKPVNKLNLELKSYVTNVLKTKYYDFNLTHFREKLVETEGIIIGRETLRKWAHEIGLVKKSQRRGFKRAHKPRPRMPRMGMLIQFDGSEHDWFNGSGPICTLLGGIDDATGKIVGLEFFPCEDTFSCLKIIKDIVKTHGLPDAFYLDQGKCFGKISREQTSTQVGRALSEIGCRVIFASTPQAKGRIERLWGTLQDRLIAELRIRGINRMPRANEFLKEFIIEYNKKFSVPARDPESAFKSLQDSKNLEDVFCVKELRKINSGNTFSIDQQLYLVNEKIDLRFRTMTIRYHYDLSVTYEVYGRKVTVTGIGCKAEGTRLRKSVA